MRVANVASALTFSAALGVGGFMLAERANDAPASEVDSAKTELTQVSLGYVAIGGEGTCESHVLSTMLNINAKNTPASESLTETALNNVCGTNDGHRAMAEKAKKGFHDILDARDSLDLAKDHSTFDLKEKIFAPEVAMIGGWIILGLALLGRNIISRSISDRINQQPVRSKS